MKWFRNKEMLNDILEQNENELEKYKHDKIVSLLKDESNLIKDHLELLNENERITEALKKEIALLKERRDTFWVLDADEDYAVVREIIEELEEILKCK